MPKSFTLRGGPDFDFTAVATSHGWSMLEPYAYDHAAKRLDGVLGTVARRPLGFSVRGVDRGVCVTLHREVSPRMRDRARVAVSRMLSFDISLAAFHAHCRRHPPLRWIARQRMGRMLRAETLFEDLAKTLMTTNCTWTGTVSMVQRAVAIFGRVGDRERRAFPDPESLANAGPERLREELRVGYRAGPLCHLARQAADGALAGFETLESQELAQNLRSLPGFGEYAASSSLLVMGRPDYQIVDSWALARAAEQHGAGRRITPARLRRIYAHHGEFRGLVAWFDLRPG
ncbi:MAG: hypothetical protein CMJ83_21035 [Planctomycetes bacterium]|nr:hypothetical protein [Planctomycetota bacterium]